MKGPDNNCSSFQGVFFIQGVVGKGNGKITDYRVFETIPEIKDTADPAVINKDIVIIEVSVNKGSREPVQ